MLVAVLSADYTKGWEYHVSLEQKDLKSMCVKLLPNSKVLPSPRGGNYENAIAVKMNYYCHEFGPEVSSPSGNPKLGMIDCIVSFTFKCGNEKTCSDVHHSSSTGFEVFCLRCAVKWNMMYLPINNSQHNHIFKLLFICNDLTVLCIEKNHQIHLPFL